MKGAEWSEGEEWSDPLAMHQWHRFIAYSNSTEQKYLDRLFDVNMQKSPGSWLRLRLGLALKKETAAGGVLAHHRTEAGHPPQRPVDGGGVMVHQIGKAPLQQGGGLPSVVMRNAWVDVMAQVGGTNAVVQQV